MHKKLAVGLAFIGALFWFRKPLWCAIAGHVYPGRWLVGTEWAFICPSCGAVTRDAADFIPMEGL